MSAASVVTVRGKPRQGSASPRASANQHQRCVGHRSSGQNPAKNGDYLMLNPVFVERLNEGPYVLLSPREYVQRVTFDPLTVVKVKRKKRKEKKREEKRREEKRREEKRKEKRKEKKERFFFVMRTLRTCSFHTSQIHHRAVMNCSPGVYCKSLFLIDLKLEFVPFHHSLNSCTPSALCFRLLLSDLLF